MMGIWKLGKDWAVACLCKAGSLWFTISDCKMHPKRCQNVEEIEESLNWWNMVIWIEWLLRKSCHFTGMI